MELHYILAAGAIIVFVKVARDLLVWRSELLQRERADALDRALAETDEWR
jgi:hypothetical protein